MGSHAMTDILDQLHGAHWADASERLRLVNLAADEIERLRKTLQQIANIDYRGPMPDGVAIARKALGDK